VQYWYSIRGDSVKRGVADELVLFEMAKKGKIKPNDLVWCTASGSGWVAASTVPGLFSTEQSARSEAAPDSGTGESIPSPGPAASTKSRLMVPILIALALAAITGALALMAVMIRERAGHSEALPQLLAPLELEAMATSNELVGIGAGLAAVASSNAAAYLRDRISVCFDADRLDEAEKLINELRENCDDQAGAARLSSRLAGLKRTASRRAGLEIALRQGTLDSATAVELFIIYKERGEEKKLEGLVESMLRERLAMTWENSLSVARLCEAAGWQVSERVALREFDSHASLTGPAEPHLEAARMYEALGEQLKGADLLERYLTNSPLSSAAWFELAAIRSASGDSKSAMKALQMAIEQGGDAACSSARRELRFAPIRDSRAFKTLVGIK